MGGDGGWRPAAAYAHETRTFVRRTADCALVLAADGSSPLALRGTALAIWDAFALPRSLDDVAQELAASYGAPLECVEVEVASLVEALHGSGLLAARQGRDEP
jgi:hypothetical protein